MAVPCPDASLKVAVMQPYFFTYLSYWQLVQAVDTFVIFDDVSYINKGYVDRNNILIDGQPFSMKLELQGASQNKRINEIKVGGNRMKLLKTIERAYNLEPNFDEALPVISEILMMLPVDSRRMAMAFSTWSLYFSSALNLPTCCITPVV